jgi:hypothetical protein
MLAHLELTKAYDTLYQTRHATPVVARDVDHCALAKTSLEKAAALAARTTFSIYGTGYEEAVRRSCGGDNASAQAS